jgi:hypothetical protein
MSRYDASENTQPLMWLRGHAIHASHFIVLVYVASMLITTLFMATGVTAPLTWLPYSSGAVLKGEVWRILTYGLVNPPSLWFVVDMFMIVWFGRELEKFFGRRVFLRFYAGLYVLTPLLFTIIGLWLPMRLSGVTGAFALFIAFATLYPSAAFFLNLQAKWLAVILVAIYTLMALSGRDLAGLVSLWATVSFAYGFVRYEQGRFTLPRLSLWSRKPKLRVLPDLPPAEKPTRAQKAQDKSMAEIDALLDKIARSGLASLTAKERARLEQSRAELLKQRGPRG